MPTPQLRLVWLSLLFIAGLPLGAQPASPVTLTELTCEHLSNPLGIGVAQPRLSWKIKSDRAGEIQTAYEIRAAATLPGLTNGTPDLWNSGKVASDQSVLVPWGGQPLASRSQVFWQARIWDREQNASAWSRPASFELGLLAATNEWKGQWITVDLPRVDFELPALAKAAWINAGSLAGQPATVRLALDLPANAVVRDAAIDAAADGLITIYVNGNANRQGSSSKSAPLHADTHAQFVPGKNIIAINSAAVRGAVRTDRGAPGRNAIAAHGFVELENHQRIEFDTDGAWKAAVITNGDWFATNYDDSAWAAATVLGPYREAPSKYVDSTVGPARYLRKGFTVKGAVSKARLYATALGVYEVSLNGQRVNHDSVLDPGWTDYKKRVMVQTYDVTPLLRSGANAVGAVLSDGWYAGRVGWMGLFQFGPRPIFNAQLEITYQNGASEMVATDDSWRGGPGEIIGSDQQWGEIMDARKAVAGWDSPGLDETSWRPAIVEQHTVALDPQRGPPVRALMELKPLKITRRDNAWLVDFGQNLVGHVRLFARGAAGTTITVQHAEMLAPNGTLYTENLRPALSRDTFILAGSGRETFEPHFTFHGFRYAEISGYPGDLSATDIRGVVVGSDTPATGTWESSDKNLNQLFSNITWGQRGNFISVPTDCPQRDERMGWMGDALVFAPTAARNADVSGFFTKWLVDVDDAQSAQGDFANYSPRVVPATPASAGWPVWGDAGVVIPWTMYAAYGDLKFLEDHYPAMVRWVEFNKGRANNLILSGGVGDHLAPRATPPNVVDTAFFAQSARMVARAAALLGRTEDAAKYKQLRQDIVAAFNKAFVSEDGSIMGVGGLRGGGGRIGNTQTAYLLALRFDLLPENLRPVVVERLAKDIEQAGHITTGFVGVGLICPTLTQVDRSDLAWQLLFTDTYPSWLFSVKNGATTIWERWDGWTPERGFQDSAMNSFNHYSFGSVGQWLYSGAAGIQLDEAHPGYKHFVLAPQITSRLGYVKASLNTPYGVIASHWQVEKEQVQYDVTVPPNSSATLLLPVPPQQVRQAEAFLPADGKTTTQLALAAGKYHFSFPLKS